MVVSRNLTTAPYRRLGATAEHLKSDSHSSVYHSAIEWRPCIGSPPAVHRLLRANQRIPARLSHTAEIFGIDEQPNPTEAALDQRAEQHVRGALRSKRVVLQALGTREVRFQPDSSSVFFPLLDETPGVRRQEVLAVRRGEPAADLCEPTPGVRMARERILLRIINKSGPTRNRGPGSIARNTRL